MTKRSEDRAPTTEAMLKGAIKAQLNQAERLRKGGAHDLVASLPREHQRTVLRVVDET